MLWAVVAWVVSREPIANYLIQRAKRTEYFHLPGYMDRWWLFNGYGNDPSTPEKSRHGKPIPWLPSIRIHHILREDYARDMHDHPWNARTIILKGDYDEDRFVPYPPIFQGGYTVKQKRERGDTATLKFGEYHNITRVSEGGVWTMFFTYKYMGTWGFLVNGRKIPHEQYNNGGAA
jgi:hypothetical protein